MPLMELEVETDLDVTQDNIDQDDEPHICIHDPNDVVDETKPPECETLDPVSEALATSTETPPASDIPAVDRPIQTEEIISDGVYEWEQAKARLEHTISDLTIEKAMAAARAKTIKKLIDCFAEELADLRDSGPQPIKWIIPPAVVEQASDEQQATGRSGHSIPYCDPSTPPPADNAWRSVSIDELDNHGLKPALLEKLHEAGLDTIGQLEDRRADISQGREKWPKGIGAAKITQIEDGVVAWLTANRDAAVFQQQQVQPVESCTNDTQNDTSPVSPTWEDLDGNQQIEFILARADAINTGEPNCLDHKHPAGDKFWQSGAEAYKRGDELRHCPYVPGAEMDDFIRGWLGMGAVDNWEKSTVIGEAANDPPKNTVDLMDL